MATSKTWPGYIPNGDIDPDSPLTTNFFTDIRNSISNLADRVGTPTTYDPDVEDHNHDGDNSKQVANQGLFGTGSLGDIAFLASGAFPAGGVLDYGSLTIAAGATITVPDGFVVIRCTGDCTINGRIDADGGGGAGGTGGGNTGIDGTQPFDFIGRQTAAGGGDNDVSATDASGGGGGAGIGGNGGRGGPSSGGNTRGAAGTNPYADDALSYGIDDGYWLLQGGAFAEMRGGGGGEGGNGNDGGSGKDGGAGGGTVILLVQGDLSGSGKILGNGEDGAATPTDQTRGGGGGGGGGLIYILCEGSISGSLDLQAAGGDGSSATSSADSAGGGGGGGGGVIITKATGTITGTSTDVAGGTKGTSDGGSDAEDGDAGYTYSQASVDVRGSWT